MNATQLVVAGHVIRLHTDPDCPPELAAVVDGTPWCYDIAPEDQDDLAISSCSGWESEAAAREAALADLRGILGDHSDTFFAPGPMVGTTNRVFTEEGHIYEPWTNGWAVGFRVTHGTTGQVTYAYLNPSSSDDPSGNATPFLYDGPDGDPAGADMPVCYINLFDDAPEKEA